ncbi:MAG: PQQ-binding-like beta-propeller repeat protein [Dysgonamonadaceae bacterium]|nr:PQQ-binding-like beta-propeller repeat protein [Dysgonamonadaceae bacterium]
MKKIFFTTIAILVSLLMLGQTNITPFKFALITDTHIGSPNNDEDLQRTIDDINQNQPEVAFAIVSGDITEFGSDEELTIAKNLFDQLKVPAYIIPGNHDSNWSESGTNSFLTIFGTETFGFEYNGYKFFGLPSGPNMRMGPGQIPREGIEWFKQQLAETDKDMPLIFVNHYPMNNTLNNWFEVMDALKPYNIKVMLCGHGHNNRKHNFEGVNAAMLRSNLRAKKDYGAYNIVSVTKDSIIFQERVVSGETLDPWLSYATHDRTKWEENPPRPDYSINDNHNFVKEIWSMQESGDMGGGMALHKNNLIYTNTKGEIKAVNARTGKKRWSYQTGGKIYSTPVMCSDKVWVASTDKNLYGLRLKNGKPLLTLPNDKSVVASAACDKNSVILPGTDGKCTAWSAKTGKQLWQFDEIENFTLTRPLVKDGVVYFGSWGNEFYALNTSTGKLKWKWNNGQTNRMFSPAQVVPIITHNKVFLASPDRFMTVLDEQTGAIIWRHNDLDNRVRESIGVSEDGNTIYAKTMDGNILAIDATMNERKIKWISSGEDMGYELTPTPVVEKNGVVYAPTDKGLIYAYSAADGSYLWKYRIATGLINMILPTDANELYVSSMDGKLMKLKVMK